MAGKDPGFVETFARGIAENLLGENSKGFSRAMDERAKSRRSEPYSLRKGGAIKKPGNARLHKGEMVARKASRSKGRGCTR